MCSRQGGGRWKKQVGFGLAVLSFLFYGGLAIMPFSSLPAREKVILSSILVVCGEASFLLAVLILGGKPFLGIEKWIFIAGFLERKKDRRFRDSQMQKDFGIDER